MENFLICVGFELSLRCDSSPKKVFASSSFRLKDESRLKLNIRGGSMLAKAGSAFVAQPVNVRNEHETWHPLGGSTSGRTARRPIRCPPPDRGDLQDCE